MVRYFLHLRDGTDELLDPEGKEFASLDELRGWVLDTARDVMVGDLRRGIVDFRFRIDAEDDVGRVVYSLPFENAISIIRGSASRCSLAVAAAHVCFGSSASELTCAEEPVPIRSA